MATYLTLPALLLLLLLLLDSTLSLPPIATAAVDSQSQSNGSDRDRDRDRDHSPKIEWQVVTSQNFSTQIRLHPHILLLVTVPWCGESRSLMAEISQKLADEQHLSNSLKLMVVYRNHDKVLSKSLESDHGITVLFYHNTISYRYRGNLVAQDVLSSARYIMSLPHEQLPLIRIKNSEDLDMFLASTDKAVILLDSCGWTPRLLAQHNGNGTSKGVKDEVMHNEVEDEFGKSPWVGEFSAENHTASSDEDGQSSFGASCSYKEYNNYNSFFLKFITVAKDLYLPPGRQRYALVSEKSLLLPLGIEVSDQWSLIISYSGCPGCLRMLKIEDHVQDILEMTDLPVTELEDEGKGSGPSLPVDQPSFILFINRTTESTEAQAKALQAFKQVALQYWMPHEARGQNVWPKRSSLYASKGSAGILGNRRSVLSTSSQKIKLSDKMSIMILNEGHHVTIGNEASDLQSSLHEILAQLVEQKKQLKLSSVAKQVGFQLLSDDIDISDVASDSSQTEGHDPLKKETGVSYEALFDINKNQVLKVSSLLKQELSDAPDSEKQHKVSSDLGSEESLFVGTHQSVSADETHVLEDESEDVRRLSSGLTASFFVSYNNYRFLRSLIGDTKFPRLVIIDPRSQQHYVFPEAVNLSISSISTFIDEFHNRTLVPCQRSGPFGTPIELPPPPFVNLDFHEKDSIPSVTTEKFSELVFGSGESDIHNSSNPRHKDILVLFTNSWCGFCQRMELTVREAYRALKGFAEVATLEPMSDELFPRGHNKDTDASSPTFYSMDCTLNECASILKSTGQREVYPMLLLFPAEKKTAIPYDGNMMVADILRFIANHGSLSHHLAKQKGALWMERELGGTFDMNDSFTSPSVTVGTFLSSTIFHGSGPFTNATVLVVAVDRVKGFQGLILNKSIPWESVPLSGDLELLKKHPLLFGGPVIHEGLPLVSLTKKSLNNQLTQVLPGIYFLDQFATANEIEELKSGNQSATDYWFFLGYAGWSWDQLYNEIAEGVWNIHEGKISDFL